MKLHLLLTAGLACAGLAACDDDSAQAPFVPDMTQTDMAAADGGQGGAGGAGGAGGEGGEGGQGGAGGDLDMGAGGMGGGEGGMGGEGGGEADMAVDMAQPDLEPDMAEPDMLPIDAEPPLVMPGDACGEGMACPEEYSCVEDACRYDLAPQVWRMIDAQVVEPAGSAAELQAFLQLGVSTGSLNLMFESGTYLDDMTGRTSWYVGNGYEDRGTWFYRRDDRNGNGMLDEGEDRNGNGQIDGLPIQNFDGFWYMTDDHGPEWRLDGEADFLLVVPAGSRELEDGSTVNCDVRFAPRVRVQIWQADGFLRGRAAGYLARADVEAIELVFNGQVIRFADFLQEADLIDVDGDGELDAYPFDLRMEAEAVAFGDDAPNAGNRDADPPFNPHPACME